MSWPPHPGRMVDLRQFMASFPTGVSVVTTSDIDGTPRGMTCTSLCSVSVDPPILLACLRSGSPTLKSVLASGVFSVNLLGAPAVSVAALFASGASDRFDQVAWRRPYRNAGPHLHDAALAVADCMVRDRKTVADHEVVFGDVVRINCQPETSPLLYGLRRYAMWPAG